MGQMKGHELVGGSVRSIHREPRHDLGGIKGRLASVDLKVMATNYRIGTREQEITKMKEDMANMKLLARRSQSPTPPQTRDEGIGNASQKAADYSKSAFHRILLFWAIWAFGLGLGH